MTIINRLYYDPARPSAFSALRKLRFATAQKNFKPDVIKAWLENVDAYTIHGPVRKSFAPNPFRVSNVMNVWECDLLVAQAYAKYNDNYRYIFSVFSKFLHLIHIRTKSGPSVA